MRKLLLFFFLIFFNLILQAQKDTVSYAAVQRNQARESTNIKILIYPVPVRNDSFTIKTDRDMSFVKVTNIIGQDIYRIKYSNPQQLIRVPLDAPQRGMYLVTIIFNDGFRVVKKIMIEKSE